MSDHEAVNDRASEHALTEFIRAERVRFVFIQSALPIIFSPLAAAILSLALWRVVDHSLLIGWTGGLAVLAAIRTALVRMFARRSAPNEDDVRRWERIFVVSIVLVDVWWGIGAVLLLPEAASDRALVFSFVMLMAGGHTASYSAHPATVVLGVIALTLPITIAFGLQQDTFHRAMAFVAVMYLAASFRSIRTLGYFFERTHRLAHELQRERDRAEVLARTDFLTSLNNRRAFYELCQEVVGLMHRYEHPAALVMLDIDHFKAINDRYGHAAGDTVLRAMADAIRANLRTTDVAGRLGGEEFAVLLPETAAADALAIAERLRAAVEASAASHEDQTIRFTTSAGVAELLAGDSLDQLIGRADAALYDAKHDGRNRVRASSDTARAAGTFPSSHPSSMHDSHRTPSAPLPSR